MEKSKIPTLIDEKDIGKFPLTFQFIKATPIRQNEKSAWQESKKFIAIDFYQTDQFQTFSHYKPISKIVNQVNE